MINSAIARYDSRDMRKLLIGFPDQAREAVKIGSAFQSSIDTAKIDAIIVCGMGGSAIGGDLLRAYTADTLKVPVIVNRQYTLPEFAGSSTLVIISSYSGNTEETLSVYRDAIKRKSQIVCISSDGEVERRARKNGHPLITIPKGFPPRAALGYSFFPMLFIVHSMGLIPPQTAAIDETISLLAERSTHYSRNADYDNPPMGIAKKLQGKLPIIYSASDRFDVVNLRWRCQIAENAKIPAYGNVYPEMNHNELVGWSQAFHDGITLRRQLKDMAVVVLRDREDHERVQQRMDLTRKIIRTCAGNYILVHSEGKSLLARMFSLIYLGDWVSYYLALLNHADPTPIAVIDYLKEKLNRRLK